MKIEIPCPNCGQMPTEALDLRDGEIWLCLACGCQEVGAGVDVEAQLVALAAVDPALAACWREALGLSRRDYTAPIVNDDNPGAMS